MKKILSLIVVFVFLVSIAPAFGGAQGKVNSGRKARKAFKDATQKAEQEWARLEAEMGFVPAGDERDVSSKAGTKRPRGSGFRSR